MALAVAAVSGAVGDLEEAAVLLAGFPLAAEAAPAALALPVLPAADFVAEAVDAAVAAAVPFLVSLGLASNFRFRLAAGFAFFVPSFVSDFPPGPSSPPDLDLDALVLLFDVALDDLALAEVFAFLVAGAGAGAGGGGGAIPSNASSSRTRYSAPPSLESLTLLAWMFSSFCRMSF